MLTVIAITDPGLRNAVPRSFASELEVGTSLLRAEIALIRAVSTVVLAVALPLQRKESGMRNQVFQGT